MDMEGDEKLYSLGLSCMMCLGPAMGEYWSDWEIDEYGDTWVYCKPCDCWTAHPPETVEKYYEESLGDKNAPT